MAVPDRGDVRREIEKIRLIIEEFDEPADGELERLYKNYSDYVNQVNEELDQCDSLLDRNQPNDAIQRADRSNLLELVAGLQFPDRDAWEEYLEGRELSPPPRLATETAARLQRCYGPSQIREPLLRQLRWHSLAKSPLRSRLEVLWQLHEADPQPETWESDISEYQDTRLKQITAEVEEADAGADLRHLERLYRELKHPRWLGNRDEALISRTRDSFVRHRAESARRRIPAILQEMRAAEAGGRDNVAAGRRLVDKLDKALEFAMLDEGSELLLRAREAVEWIEQIDQEDQVEADYNNLISQLTHTLDSVTENRRHLDRAQLRDMLRQIEQKLAAYDEGIPTELRKRLDSTYYDLEIEERRRFTLRMALAVVAVCAGAGLVFFAVQWERGRRELARHQDQLGTLVERADFPATGEYVEKLKEHAPHILEHPSISSLIATHEQNMATESSRAARITGGLYDVRNALDSAETLEAVAELGSQLTALETHVEHEHELKQIDEVQQLLGARRAAIQKSIDEDFQTRLGKLSDQYEETDSHDVAALRSLQGEFKKLSSTSKASASLLPAVATLVERINLQVDAELEDRDQQQRIEAITEAVGSYPNYTSRLEQYVAAYPKSSRGLQFERVLTDDAPLWNTVEENNAFVKRWSALDFSVIDPATAKTLAQEGQAFLAKHPKFAKRERVEEITNYLEGVAKRISSGGTPIQLDLDRVFRDSTVAGLTMVLTKDGARYYMDRPPVQMDDNLYSVRAFDDASLTTRSRQVVGVQDMNLLMRGGKIDWTAPQSAFAREAAQLLRRMPEGEWEETMLAVLDRLYSDPRMEPIMKFQLMDNILPVAMQGSPLLKEALQKTADEMRAIRLPTSVNVFDPKDLDTKKARRDVVEFLAATSNPGGLRASIVRKKLRFRRPDLGGTYTWVGWLYSGPEGWVCAAPRPPGALDTGSLFSGTKLGDGFGFAEIGRIIDKEYKVTASPSNFAEGSLVYLYAPLDGGNAEE